MLLQHLRSLDPDALHRASLGLPGADASRKYQWPATHRQRRIQTSQPRSSRPESRGEPSGVAGCVHDQPSPNSAQIESSPNRSNASSAASATASGSAILITPPGGPMRLEIVGSRASCDSRTTAIRVPWGEGRRTEGSLASAEAPARSPVGLSRADLALPMASRQFVHIAARRPPPARGRRAHATPRRFGGTRLSSFRELMSNFRKTLCRWYWTVRGLMNSLAPISGLEKPSLASRATCAS